MTTGNSWNYEVESPGASVVLDRVEVTRVDSRTGAYVFTEALQGDAASTPFETLFVKDASGVAEIAGTSTDDVTRLVLPSQRLVFPLEPGRSFVQVDRNNVDLGRDIDGDRVNDRFSYHGVASVGAVEPVALAIGSVMAIPVKATVTVVVMGSTGRSATGQLERTEWYAAGIGLVQSVTSQNGNPGQRVRLVGYSVEGRAKGIVRFARLLTGVAPADSNTLMPGQPVLSFDGSTHLLISPQSAQIAVQSPARGYIVDPKGTVGPGFTLAATYGAAAFDGTNHLAVLVTLAVPVLALAALPALAQSAEQPSVPETEGPSDPFRLDAWTIDSTQ